MGDVKTVTIKLVNGVNYIGRGYHFTAGAVAEMSKEDAVPFLKLKVGDKARFALVDAEIESLMGEDDEDVSVDVPEPVKAKTITVNPTTITDPKALKTWLIDHGIKVAKNATMATMVKLIPVQEEEETGDMAEDIVIK